VAKKPKQFTDLDIAKLPVKRKRYAEPDTDQRGLYIRVTPKGTKSFVAVATGLDGKQIWKVIGHADIMPLEGARQKAREIIKAIKTGADTAGPQSFKAVSDQWLKRHVEKKALRSADAIRGHLTNHILPAWSGREFTTIRRVDVAKLLDQIEDSSGPVAADAVLNTIGNISRWYATRHEGYASPVVKGMRRSNPKERARDRILSDEELRAVWKQAEANGAFGTFIRLSLLTGQRLSKVAGMRWDDVSIDGVWHIPSEKREKGNAGDLELPQIAINIIQAQHRFADNPYVLAGRGKGHINGFSKAKKAFDAKVVGAGAELEPWTIHDLRRTARSLMSRAGVDFHIAERTLGHVIKGVAGTYDRHDYQQQRGEALRKLAGLVEQILRGPLDKVVPIRA
jgi:integrase